MSVLDDDITQYGFYRNITEYSLKNAFCIMYNFILKSLKFRPFFLHILGKPDINDEKN